MFSMSLEAWKDVCEVGGLILLALTVVFGGGALFVNKRLNAIQDEQLLQFNKDLTDAKIDLGKQQERAARAELETEKLKQVVAWRVIPPNSATELEKVLAAKPGVVNLRYTDGDPEALFLAIQVSQILAKAKWQVAPGSVKFANAIQFGIALPDSAGGDAQTLRAAFADAKIEFSPGPLPPQGAAFSISTIPGAPTLMIGSRAPVQIK
jgi:hypothetical protein